MSDTNYEYSPTLFEEDDLNVFLNRIRKYIASNDLFNSIKSFLNMIGEECIVKYVYGDSTPGYLMQENFTHYNRQFGYKVIINVNEIQIYLCAGTRSW